MSLSLIKSCADYAESFFARDYIGNEFVALRGADGVRYE